MFAVLEKKFTLGFKNWRSILYLNALFSMFYKSFEKGSVISVYKIMENMQDCSSVVINIANGLHVETLSLSLEKAGEFFSF